MKRQPQYANIDDDNDLLSEKIPVDQQNAYS